MLEDFYECALEMHDSHILLFIRCAGLIHLQLYL